MSDTPAKDEPSKKLQEKVRQNPENTELQVDLGNDESMDASDANASVQPGAERGDPVADEQE